MKKIINWINGIENEYVIMLLPILFVFGGTFLPILALGRIIERDYSFGIYIFIFYVVIGFVNLGVSVYYYWKEKDNNNIPLVEDCMLSFLLGNGGMFLITAVLIVYKIIVS